MKDLLEKLYLENTLGKDELVHIIEHITEEDKKVLFDYSDRTRRQYYDDKVYMRGLIEFTNICKQHCSYCGLRSENNKVDRYRLTKEQIIGCCEEGYRLGYRTFVMQGGEDPYYTDELLVEIITFIKETYKDVAITLSIGERDRDSYKRLFEAGADRFLLRHETASKELYESLHPKMSYENRVRCLEDLKDLGYQVGAGFMVGLPNQTAEHLAEDLLFLKALDPDMIGIGPFIPHSDTLLGKELGGTLEDTLLMVALTRLMVPGAMLPATTALGTLDAKGREAALKVGANVVMPNLSPTSEREKYEIYEGKICTGDEAAHCRGCIEKRINAAGYQVDMIRGDSYKYLHS